MNMQLMSCPSHKQQHCQLINAITGNQCNTGPFVRTTHINMHHLNTSSVKTLSDITRTLDSNSRLQCYGSHVYTSHSITVSQYHSVEYSCMQA